ncbi:MAG: hypothetical protein OXJ90_10610 [Spirochaetaceae bacterium]|nr:hypothetical protein [Spirochaetaceae bacterium]
MIYSSCIDNVASLVLDTSVLINLHASGVGGDIIAALPHDILVPQVAADELQRERTKETGQQLFIQRLVGTHKARLIEMDEREQMLFSRLVSGSPSLGDGEAATIAIGVSRDRLPIIDERKGRLLAQVHLAGNEPGWSLDLFLDPRVMATLGINEAVEALYLALRYGRMRIHKEHCDGVVKLIGYRRALECNSLPGYKVRRGQWEVAVAAASGQRCKSA